MNILVIHQHYLSPGQPGGSRFNEMARLWCAAGHQVEVVAGTVNYATGERPQRYARRWITPELDGGVTVWRCYVPQTYNSGYVGRAWAFAGFILSACCAVFMTRRPDVVIASSPPLTVAVPGRLASLVSRAPLVFEMRDLWPESAVTTRILNESSLLARWLYLLERWACRTSALVNVVTPMFRDNLLSRSLAPESKIVCVPNGADVAFYAPGPRDNETRHSFGWGNRIVALYAGAHGRANAIGQLVDAAERLRDRPDILIACVGDGPERARWQAEARRRGLENIQLCEAQPKERMAGIINAADIGLAVLQCNPTFRTVYPNKVFDYMACERPTVIAIDGAARRLVCDDAQAGVYAQPENPQAIAHAITALADDPATRAKLGRNGRAWVMANATREMLARRYLEHLERVVAADAARAAVPNSARSSARSIYRRFVKPLLDRTAAALLLVLLAPLIGLAAFGVRILIGSPVLFRQPRPGRHGQVFTLLKFRTMRDARNVEGGLLPDNERLTRFGRILRATSIDELPELMHVLRGEMSLVGPRPLLCEYLERYSPEQARRHEVKPGITGWAQVNGRNALTWEQKLALDEWYVDRVSFWLDLKILGMTALQLITRHGISEPGHATASEFLGRR